MTSTTRAARIIAALLVLSVFGSIAFAIAYSLQAVMLITGSALVLALGGLAAGSIMWAMQLLPHEIVTNEREEPASPPGERIAAEADLEEGGTLIARRGWLSQLCALAIGTLVVAALFPIRSLAPENMASLFHTKWRRGSRLVRDDGTPVRFNELEIGTVLTVFPEGYVEDADSQTVLIRVPDGTVQQSADRAGWSPQGCVAFSKVCTHAGCPVALYRKTDFTLVCPCHQSIFDVVHEAQPIAGPAARALPQLPLTIDANDGYLRAQSDFTEPIGPGFWERSV